MTDKQPEALRLADVLREEGESWWDYAAAAELRLQNSQIECLSGLVAEKNKVIAELVETLFYIRDSATGLYGNNLDLCNKALAKATGEQHG